MRPCGRRSITPCWSGWQEPGSWTGAARRSTTLASRPNGGTVTGTNLTDRGKRGTKRRLVVDARGTPLSVVMTRANANDSTKLTATAGRDLLDTHGPTGTHAPQARQAACRQCSRLPSLSQGMPGTRDRAPHRPPGHREQPAPGTAPLGRGTHLGVARPLPPARYPLRTPRRHPPRLHHPRLRRRYTQPVQKFHLDALSQS